MSEHSSNRFLTVKNLAERCQVTERTVRNWIEGGDLRVHRLGGAIRVSPENFEDFINRAALREPKVKRRENDDKSHQ